MSNMEYRRLGRSGLEASVLCLGTMTFGDRTSADEARRIVASAHDAGVNFIDTADVYVKGESERIVGAAIKAHRRQWILATKAGNVLTARPHDGGLSRRWLVQACEDSLGRLGTDWIDVYYLHKDDWADAARRDGRRDRRPDPRRQDPLLRRLQLPRLAHRRGGARVRAPERAAPGDLPAVLQPAEPHARGGDPAGLRPLRHRRRAVLADRPRRVERQVRDRRRARPPTRARRSRTSASWRPSTAPSPTRSRRTLAAHAQRTGRTLTAFALAWLWANRILSSVVAGPRTLAQWHDYTAAVGTAWSDDDEALVDSLVASGAPVDAGVHRPALSVLRTAAPVDQAVQSVLQRQFCSR